MSLIYPMFCLVLLTFAVGFALGGLRTRAALRGEVQMRYFRLMIGEAPPYLKQLERNFSNLFEVPVLFYAACILALMLQLQNPLVLALAWLFVGLRLVHTLIHVTYNNSLHRFFAFIGSSLAVLALWILLLLQALEV